ncbi:O-antigen ligase family protein [Polynucleobacter sp. AP-Kaivos-20-H2]|nr:O-antigen ligase family protein [Polynucleobacter sp. AP-Kaivos-20-H2]
MVLGAKTPIDCTSRANFARLSLAIFALLAGVIASGSVLFNDAYFWGQSRHYINPYLFGIAFILGLPRKDWGLIGFVFLLPLSAGLGNQLNAYIGTSFLVLPNAGLDLAAGFFLGALTGSIGYVKNLYSGRDRFSKIGLLITEFNQLVPWPIALVILMITISTAIAISRNTYQSAAATSFKGLLFNLVHFRPIGWHDDYMPISDWIAYALAVAVIITVIGFLKGQDRKNKVIFRAIMAGLIVAALMGIIQALTGIGLPENLLSFRKDQLGYAVIGFQPDLHAFAGHMLLGAVGLWGYFYSGISGSEKKIVVFVIAFSWTGLILSKSRALLLFALIEMFIWLLWCIWREKRSLFVPLTSLTTVVIGVFLVLIFSFSNSLNGVPILSWLADIANQLKSRDLSSWSLFSGIFGARFEIWEGALRMWSQFPLMGVGQGNFYRLSDIASFSRSNFLILNHGENAHNYFLQTFTETGIIGAIIFFIATISPLLKGKNKKLLIPAFIALTGLFLGNIFSHSFLVRENLLLACSIIGLTYASSLVESSATESNHFSGIKKNKYRVRVLVFELLMFIGIFFGSVETIRSFGKPPFEYGASCFVDAPQDSDGWTNGQYSFVLPNGVMDFKLTISNYLPGQRGSTRPLKVSLINGDGLSLSADSIELRREGVIEKTIYLTGEKLNISPLETRVLLELTNCSTPRNIGLSLDSRRLGLYLTNSIQN